MDENNNINNTNVENNTNGINNENVVGTATQYNTVNHSSSTETTYLPKGMSTAALTLGIISIVTNLFWYMSLPTGIMAIIFGGKSIKKSHGKVGRPGLVTGIVGVSITVFIYALLIAIFLVEDGIV